VRENPTTSNRSKIQRTRLVGLDRHCRMRVSMPYARD
jgi:hypothetical protein